MVFFFIFVSIIRTRVIHNLKHAQVFRSHCIIINGLLKYHLLIAYEIQLKHYCYIWNTMNWIVVWSKLHISSTTMISKPLYDEQYSHRMQFSKRKLGYSVLCSSSNNNHPAWTSKDPLYKPLSPLNVLRYQL